MLADAVQDVQHLLEVGGPVLRAILAVSIVLWTIIIERFWYIHRIHPAVADEVAADWDGFPDKDSWGAQAIRRMWISQLSMRMDRGLAMIRALVSVCPLLGLLRTTTGMVHVYEVMAIAGNGEPRMMADGVSQAMVTTMAGLVVALSGIFFSTRLEGLRIAEYDRLVSRLQIEEDLLAHHHRVRNAKAKERTRRANERRHRRLHPEVEPAELEDEPEAISATR